MIAPLLPPGQRGGRPRTTCLRAVFDAALGVAIEQVIRTFRPLFRGPIIGNGRFDLEKAKAFIDEGLIQMASFGRPFIANSDLPERFALGSSLNSPDPATFYGEGPKGYVDYPTAA